MVVRRRTVLGTSEVGTPGIWQPFSHRLPFGAFLGVRHLSSSSSVNTSLSAQQFALVTFALSSTRLCDSNDVRIMLIDTLRHPASSIHQRRQAKSRFSMHKRHRPPETCAIQRMPPPSAPSASARLPHAQISPFSDKIELMKSTSCRESPAPQAASLHRYIASWLPTALAFRRCTMLTQLHSTLAA